jgi:bifunctional non-homologous end joining protein LigD
VFDLDPGEGADVLSCGRVAFLLRDVLRELHLECFAKVSGSKGLQIHVPLNTNVNYAVTQPFAKAVAELLSQQHPKFIVADMAKALRRGKVFIDWSQNSDFKTTVGVYSLRAKTDQPFVSVPVTWNELESAVTKRKAADLHFNVDAALARVEELGDLFKPVLAVKQKLPLSVLKHLGSKIQSPTTPTTRKKLA